MFHKHVDKNEFCEHVCSQNGTLKIVDRKKHIFKLAQGEYIAPEKIENVYIRSDAVAQVFVHGDSLQVGGGNCPCMCLELFTVLLPASRASGSKSFWPLFPLVRLHWLDCVYCVCLQACLVAVVVPDPDFLSGWTKRTLGLQGSYQELCARAVILFRVF